MEGQNEVIPVASEVVHPVIAPVEHAANTEVVQPVVDMAGRVGTIEERQKNHEMELARQLGDLEQRLSTAYASELGSVREQFERRLGEIQQQAQKEEEETPVAATLDTVDMPPAPKPKRKGLYGRRKDRRNE